MRKPAITGVAMFRKKPVVIEAIRWDGQNMDAFNVWLDPPDGGSVGLPFHVVDLAGARCLAICTLEGTMIAQPGDWIIKGMKGEFYPCKPDIFAATYEPATVSEGEEQGSTRSGEEHLSPLRDRIAVLEEALGEIAGKNDLSGVPNDLVESAACNALYECELIARAALSNQGRL